MAVRWDMGSFPLRLNDHDHTNTLSLQNMKINAPMGLSPDKVSKKHLRNLGKTILEIINNTNDIDGIT